MILGIDLSLTATGLALIDDVGGLLDTDLVKSAPAADRIARYVAITDRIVGAGVPADIRIALEGYSFASTGSALTNLGELRGILLYRLRPAPVVEIPPGRWRKLLFGKGNLKKDEVRLHVERKFKHLRADLAELDLNVIEAFCVAQAARLL